MGRGLKSQHVLLRGPAEGWSTSVVIYLVRVLEENDRIFGSPTKQSCRCFIKFCLTVLQFQVIHKAVCFYVALG